MILNNSTKITEIQKAFQKVFSNLKIEFYNEPHDPGKGSVQRNHLPEDSLIGNSGFNGNESDLIWNENMTVQEFETEMSQKFGLFVQVFRKSGNLWMQTTATDSWTLSEQNRKGGASEEHYNNKP
jgi:hypothetical protein